MTKEVDITIIVPVYFNQETLRPLFERLQKAIPTRYSFEAIFVDDGSGDQSYTELIKLKQDFPDIIKVIKFSKNFGQVPAILAGYEYAIGRVLINISADLQDPPELIPKMINMHFEENKEIVICTREEREESIYRKLTSKVFYWLSRQLSFKNMPKGGFDYALIGRKCLNEVLKSKSANPFWQGLILSTGFTIGFIPYKREERKFGKSRWSLAKKIKYLIDGIFNYSYFPIRAISVTGLLVSLFSFLYGFLIIILKFLNEIPIQGWAPIMVVILFLSGIQMIMLGVIGEYVWRTMEQVKFKSLYIIEKVI